MRVYSMLSRNRAKTRELKDLAVGLLVTLVVVAGLIWALFATYNHNFPLS